MFAVGSLSRASDRRRSRSGKLKAGLAGVVLAACSAQVAAASETRGYVVSWFNLASYSVDGDCGPGGTNPKGDEMFRRILKELGKTPAEIEKLMLDFPYNYGNFATMRGRIDGKPVNVYQNPTSVPDPKIRTVTTKVGLGFNLDGKEGPNDFTDAETGEKGVDNQLFRALGCFTSMRGTPTARPVYPEIQWDMTRDQMPAYVIQISGIDDMKNDDDVEFALYRALNPVVRNVSGNVQADMTFQVDPDTRMHKKVHARIKDGVLYTDTFDLFMIVDPFIQPEYRFKRAKLRLTLNPDGTAKGILGGYTNWDQAYINFAFGGSTNEGMLSLDMPGIYYALRHMADGDPDPKTGMNTTISSAFTIEAVPAFVKLPKEPSNKTAMALEPNAPQVR
jgi:hypothetical protein